MTDKCTACIKENIIAPCERYPACLAEQDRIEDMLACEGELINIGE